MAAILPSHPSYISEVVHGRKRQVEDWHGHTQPICPQISYPGSHILIFQCLQQCTPDFYHFQASEEVVVSNGGAQADTLLLLYS